jgi:hypothetical protein
MENPKILVASPTYEGMNYCLDEFITAVKSVSYPLFNILLVDNSRDENFSNKLKKIDGIRVIHDATPEQKNMFRLISSRNIILDYAISNNYDYLLMLDGDVIVPSNILSGLLAHKVEVVSGLYFNIFPVNGQESLRPVCWMGVDDTVFQEAKKKFPSEQIINKDDIRRFITPQEVEIGALLDVLHPSAGCLLLSRRTFSCGARYGLLNVPQGTRTSDDIYFIKQLREKGFKIYCDPSLVCKHRIEGKYSDGKHPVFD